ncbi:hypothetical protein M422DRAFT_255181 [Sphaerobolus stellatus SS14]|uniref:Uncharacterized protein n=1 Tax=Sphaerobolus stellatus (strain SS14) TaxID=990650 RepID=A0A0C9V4R6_SPHS4|nr:hypothetical protein M422DRAFT_255181 [Sphaerobolus stellatus SS14]
MARGHHRRLPHPPRALLNLPSIIMNDNRDDFQSSKMQSGVNPSQIGGYCSFSTSRMLFYSSNASLRYAWLDGSVSRQTLLLQSGSITYNIFLGIFNKGISSRLGTS